MIKRLGSGAAPPSQFNASPIPCPQLTPSVDWDAVECDNSTFGIGSHSTTILPQSGLGGKSNNSNPTDIEYMSRESMAKLLKKDEDAARRFNNSAATDFSNLTTRISAVSMSGVNQTMGAYFQSRSNYPPLSSNENETFIRLQTNLSDLTQTVIKPRESLTSFFMGPRSEGQNSEAMIDKVMKYCLNVQGNTTVGADSKKVEQRPEGVTILPISYNRKNRNTCSFEGIMDVSAISNIPSSPPHSTPKRNSARGELAGRGNRLSLMDLRRSELGVDPWGQEGTGHPQPKFVEAATSFSFKDTNCPDDKEKEVFKVPVKVERNSSPNSSISSSGTSASNVPHCQLDIYRGQRPPSSTAGSESHNPNAYQCPSCTNNGNSVSRTDYRCQNCVQQILAPPLSLYISSSCPYHPHLQYVNQMLMGPPAIRPLARPQCLCDRQFQCIPVQNTPCQCRRCTSCGN